MTVLEGEGGACVDAVVVGVLSTRVSEVDESSSTSWRSGVITSCPASLTVLFNTLI